MVFPFVRVALLPQLSIPSWPLPMPPRMTAAPLISLKVHRVTAHLWAPTSSQSPEPPSPRKLHSTKLTS